MLKSVAIFRNQEKRRWYRIDAGTDLLGDLVLVRRWGGIGTGHGGESLATPGSNAINSLITAETKRRLSRGYQVTHLSAIAD